MADMLVTPSELASFLEKDLDTATATLAIELATGLVQAVTGQQIVQVADDTTELDLDDHDGGHWLYLPQGPVAAVGAVVIGATTVLDFSVQLSRGRLYRHRGWRAPIYFLPYWSAPSTVTVTYTHGYAAGDQRLQLARSAVLGLAKTAYENPTGVTSEKIDDYQVGYDPAGARLEVGDALGAALRHQYGRRGRGSVRMLAARTR